MSKEFELMLANIVMFFMMLVISKFDEILILFDFPDLSGKLYFNLIINILLMGILLIIIMFNILVFRIWYREKGNDIKKELSKEK
ncbi:hypothetical protein ACIQZG_22110 [Lysinibacillus sp. NPDC096418]|uniref:hypothetical protein n=1 Tax=Lysinibacillus sp. NPDC096418 TaxID=3364138 RepID=UPI0037F56066